MEAARSLLFVGAVLLAATGALGREETPDQRTFPEPGVRVCLGTDMKLDLPSSLENHYETLKLLYTDCKVVHGNLEITHLHGTPDLSFLEGIVEVQGYVLVAHLSVSVLPLDNLRIIRGSQLYNSSYALAVLDNTVGGLGLRTLRLRSLTEILLGAVYIWGNPQLCYPDPHTIVWRDTLDEHNTYTREHRLQGRAPNCSSCASVCGKRCWGETAQDCQTLTRINCAVGCQRCKGPDPHDCCHTQCAAGCTGPKDSDCLACRHFNDSGVCKENCPPPTIYDPVTFQTKPNPNKKFNFGATCVKTCPYNYLAMEVACTLVCPKANQEVIVANPEGNELQKLCYGLGMDNLGVMDNHGVTMVTSSNVEQFNKCKKIFGSLAFLPQSFARDSASNTSGLSLEQLSAFKSLEEITGYLYVDAWPEEWTDLHVFENLKVIRGRMLYKICTSAVGLRSLRSVSGGLVLLHNNSQLCYTSSLPWSTLLHPTQGPHRIVSLNQDAQLCEEEGRVCHRLCKGGCWGPGPNQCVSCTAFKRGTECVDQCPSANTSLSLCVSLVTQSVDLSMAPPPAVARCTVMDERGCPVDKRPGPGTTIAAAVGGVVLFFILLALLQSRDTGLDVEPSVVGGSRSMYSSVSTLGRSQYPTLPLGASASNGVWVPQYPTLARSPSAGGQSDNVFLDGPPDDPRCPREAPGATAKDPPTPTGARATWRLTGTTASITPNPIITHCPDGTMDIIIIKPRQYVNHQIQDLRPGIPDRPSTLPRKGSRVDRRLPNGLNSGHSVENPGYLVPGGPTSPAFDNPYYLDLLTLSLLQGTAWSHRRETERAQAAQWVYGLNGRESRVSGTSGHVEWTYLRRGRNVTNSRGITACVLLRGNEEREKGKIVTKCPSCDTPTQCSINLVSVASFVFLSSSQQSVLSMSSLCKVPLCITQDSISKGVHICQNTTRNALQAIDDSIQQEEKNVHGLGVVNPSMEPLSHPHVHVGNSVLSDSCVPTTFVVTACKESNRVYFLQKF
ncbi:hypothetical protein F7725_014264 [Dissostichus mawsoni]|uniref:receptor protein-tyrosine kinase n=1 Tax=Dissostichus mawsoni TaxID=36200 RepID=A0A7J5YVW9_DISMA|nr:hypothetical protein F7725_014264 [Dissostichus mawsoni]